MKSGALKVHCWGLALADFGRDPRSTRISQAKFFLSGKQRTISPISRLQKIHENELNMHVNRCRYENFRNRILKILP